MLLQFWEFSMPYALGFFVALVWGQFVISNALDDLWSSLGRSKKQHHGAWQSTVLGTTECVLYIAALQMNKGEFIAVWLGLKTVVKWRHWESDIRFPATQAGGPPVIVLGRNAYNLFLLGNALVILFAGIGERLIDLATSRSWPSAFGLMLGTILASITLLVAAHKSPKYSAIEPSDPLLDKPESKAIT